MTAKKFPLITVLVVLPMIMFGRAGHQVKKKVPSGWIEQIRNIDYKNKTDQIRLIQDLEPLMMPDTFEGSKHDAERISHTFSPMFVNLDEDATDELIGLFGLDESKPVLTVFKKIDADWQLIYFEPYYMWYNSPELSVAANFSTNKLFYIRCLYQRGFGIFHDGYQFYKLLGGEVVQCLTLPNETRIFGWGLYLNQSVKMNKLSINSANADEIWVEYNYRFFPGAVQKDDLIGEEYPEISFVEGEQGAAFVWVENEKKYRQKLPNYDSAQLTEQKIACFGDFGNDQLFTQAFHYELKRALQQGGEVKKKLLVDYLNAARFHKTVPAPGGELKEEKRVGNMRFYGPKK
jgi:hypothetical protein